MTAAEAVETSATVEVFVTGSLSQDYSDLDEYWKERISDILSPTVTFLKVLVREYVKILSVFEDWVILGKSCNLSR